MQNYLLPGIINICVVIRLQISLNQMQRHFMKIECIYQCTLCIIGAIWNDEVLLTDLHKIILCIYIVPSIWDLRALCKHYWINSLWALWVCCCSPQSTDVESKGKERWRPYEEPGALSASNSCPIKKCTTFLFWTEAVSFQHLWKSSYFSCSFGCKCPI